MKAVTHKMYRRLTSKKKKYSYEHRIISSNLVLPFYHDNMIVDRYTQAGKGDLIIHWYYHHHFKL